MRTLAAFVRTFATSRQSRRLRRRSEAIFNQEKNWSCQDEGEEIDWTNRNFLRSEARKCLGGGLKRVKQFMIAEF